MVWVVVFGGRATLWQIVLPLVRSCDGLMCSSLNGCCIKVPMFTQSEPRPGSILAGFSVQRPNQMDRHLHNAMIRKATL